MTRYLAHLVLGFLCVLVTSTRLMAAAPSGLYARTNLVAWCIVPFDAKKRGPEERAAMLEKMGVTRLAYDYRAEHIPTFDAEMEALKRHHIELFAWWFPTELNAEAKGILDVLRRHGLKAQLWVTGSGGPTKTPEEQRAKVAAEVKRLRPIALAAAEIGCSVALYNHGGWFGEPENQIAIIQELGLKNVGIVYNQHHGHDHLARFPKLLEQMKPYLLALNLNGMTEDGERKGKKIMPLAQGNLDLSLLKVIEASGWSGPIGILNHTDEDAEARLLDNLDGLEWLKPQLHGKPAGTKPTPRSWREPQPSAAVPAVAPRGTGSLAPIFGKALVQGMLVEGSPEYRRLPLTVECRAKLNGRSGFNILVAQDPKASAEHWELYSYAGSGLFSAYLPGRGGEVKSTADICDGQWHHLGAVLEDNRVRLFVDGQLVADSPIRPLNGTPVPGGLAFGRLVEGDIRCDGAIDDVRIRRGAQAIDKLAVQPVERDAHTLGLWNFNELQSSTAGPPGPDPWALEDPLERARLPEFRIVPAAEAANLTPAINPSRLENKTDWSRSLGDAASSRFSALSQIRRDNVKRLEVAWTYHSKDGQGNIQCNPIVIDGIL